MNINGIALIIVAMTAAACTPTQETPGTVTQINEKSVTVRGPGDYSLQNAGKGWLPTSKMQAQAEEICPGAKFVSGRPSEENDAMGFSYIDFLFVCP